VIPLDEILIAAFIATQALYTLSFLIDLYLFSLPVDWVEADGGASSAEGKPPYIVLLYPVLRELEQTMRTTLLSLRQLDYPTDRYRIVAIPNANDHETIDSLKRLQADFPQLELLEVPPTSDGSWRIVWEAWDSNPKAYWWHSGPYANNRRLPPKKTRQLIYAFYHLASEMAHEPDLLIDYIDADTCPPPDHFKLAAAGIKRFDVLQAQNVAGNLNASLAASWHAFDHMVWDGDKYPHLSAEGRHPYWVLGKGVIFKASDLLALGSFHPWMAIEDPEVGLRFWANGKRLGIIRSPMIEEVPETFSEGIRQRKRWVCGFFQTLGRPLDALGLGPWQRLQAWANYLPCFLLSVNVFGIPVGAWALWTFASGHSVLPSWTVWLSGLNLAAFALSLAFLYRQTWRRTALVLDSWSSRARYMLRVNPFALLIWWLIWVIPLGLGLYMYLRDGGLIWERTKKTDANHDLVRAHYGTSGLASPGLHIQAATAPSEPAE
jgi:cellulose synthase/poly-beta-1,6-N-acetylglucosamine synthase-like glycosyltransferase